MPKLSLPSERYRPVGRCIYCGTSTGPFGDEHIIPLSLWGKLVLPKASCKSCEQITCRFEQVIAKQIFAPIRAALNAPSRRKPTFKIKYRSGGRVLEVERSKAPAVVAMPSLGLAKLSYVADAPIFQSIEMWAIYWSHDGRVDANPEVFLPDFDTIPFMQLLAKIAHSYLIAELQKGRKREWAGKSIEFLLPPLILGQSQDFDKYIGGYRDYVKGSSEVFHQLKVGSKVHVNTASVPSKVTHNGIVVHIRLFEWLDSPEYQVVCANLVDDH